MSFALPRWRPPPVAVDTVIAVVVLAALTAPFLFTARTTAPGQSWTIWQYLPVLVQTVPLVWRRRAPLAVLLVVMVGSGFYILFDPDQAPQPVPYAPLVAVYTVAAVGSRSARIAAVVIVGAAAAFQLVGAVLQTPSADTAVRSLVMGVAAWAMGRALANRQAYARQVERDRQAEVDRAALAERTAIARDVHDILGHSISLIVVQAEAGSTVVRSQPHRAEVAFDTIAATGRDAMGQVRTLLKLWDHVERGKPEPPSVAGIDGLVERVDRSGTPVTLTVTGPAAQLPSDVSAAAFRMVQEALTNVVKHAAATEATVELHWSGEALAITVTDDGRGSGGEPEPGRGLIGIRERARAHGGAATFGPGPHGRGFVVSVRLPRRAT